MSWLSDIVVVELARLLPAPLVGTVLRDLGATVIKVELLPGGDSLRGTALFELLNRGKRSVAASSEKLPSLLEGLLPQVDVLLTNYRPVTQEALGLSPQRVLEAYPHLLYVNLVGSPEGRPGHDLNFLAETGVLDRMRPGPESPPLVPYFLLGDILGGTASALIRLLAALYRRVRTGEGAYLPIYMREETFRWSVSLAHLYRLFGGKLPPAGSDFLSGALPCYRVYATQDNRYLVVAALEDKFWQAFCAFAGRPDLAPYGKALGDPYPHREMEGVIRQRTWAEWEALLQGTAFCVTPVYTFEEVLTQPWVQEVWKDGFLFFAPPTGPVTVPELGEGTGWVQERFGLSFSA